MGRVVMLYSWRYGKAEPKAMTNTELAECRDSLGRCILATSSM